jgi:L-threonylcarbamoyladenylate synthase
MTKEIADKIKKGAVGVLPTDTIYGLCCSALNPKAVERVYKIKGKPAGFPLIVLIGSLADLKKFGIKLSPPDAKLLGRLWPNSVSVILPVTDKKALPQFAYLHRGTRTISFRLPKEKWLSDFLAQTGPLIATSANIHNQENATTIEEAVSYFGERADFYVDCGKMAGKPSTVVILENGELYLLREGAAKLAKNLRYRQVIKKKTWPELFEAVRTGRKKFDLRLGDFLAEEGDLLILNEWDPKTETYTGRMIRKKIGYVLRFDPDQYPFAPAEEVKKNGLQILSLD